MTTRPLTVAWLSYFPVEWLSDVPESVTRLPRQHPGSWQRVLLTEFEKNPALRLHVIALRKQFERDLTFERNGVTFHLVKTPGGLRAPSLFWVDTLLIRRVLRAVKPDVVHAWGTEQGAALVAKRLGYSYLVTIQGLFSWCREADSVNLHERLSAWVERHSLPQAPLITTESRFSADYVRRHFPPAPVEQIEHAPDPLFHRVRRRARLAPLRFLYVGRFERRKGADLLLHALDHLKLELAFDLVFVGPCQGPLYESLRRELSAELWRRIIFKQNLTPQQVAGELAEAALLIYPTRVDVSPNVVKEAVVAGVPVIGTAVGGIPDYVFPGRNGVLCSPDHLAGLIEAIRAACRHPQFARGAVDAATLAQVRAYLAPQLMAQRFLEMYHAADRRRGTGRF